MKRSLIGYKLSVVFMAVAILFQSFSFSGVFGETKDIFSEINIKAAREHVPSTGIRYIQTDYESPEMTEPYKVIDVSAWQEEVDFKAVAESGVKAVILRLARYNLEKDPCFDANYNGAKDNGLMVGCYYFMGAASVEEAEAEAIKVAALLDENEYELELPVFYDVEDEHDTVPGNISSLDRQLLTDIIKTFCGKMQELGYYSGYYSNLVFANNHYYPEQLYMFPYWVARWSDSNTTRLSYTVWQYSATGSVPGVNGDCDLDLCFADFYSFIKERGYNNLEN